MKLNRIKFLSTLAALITLPSWLRASVPEVTIDDYNKLKEDSSDITVCIYKELSVFPSKSFIIPKGSDINTEHWKLFGSYNTNQNWNIRIQSAKTFETKPTMEETKEFFDACKALVEQQNFPYHQTRTYYHYTV